MQATRHPVDERLPVFKLFALGMQHVLVMYAGAIAVPLIIGGALNLPKSEIAYLISADLFCCGLVTMIVSATESAACSLSISCLARTGSSPVSSPKG